MDNHHTSERTVDSRAAPRGSAVAVPDPRLPGDLPKAALTVVPFLLLARELRRLFVPVRIRDEFRAELRGDLVARARAGGYAAGDDNRWVWRAAAFGSALSLAAVAYMHFSRQRGRISA